METQTNPAVPPAMPPAEPAPAAPPAAPKAKKSGILITIAAVAATAVIVGGIIFFWQSSLVKSVSLSYEQSIADLQRQISELQAQMQQIQDDASEKEKEFNSEKQQLMAQLSLQNFKLAILELWGVTNVVQDSDNNDNIYYASNFSAASNIALYNRLSDTSYLSSGVYNIPASNKVVYAEKLADGKEFEIVEANDLRILFYETEIEAVLDPCFSPLLTEDISMVDLKAIYVVRSDYTVPEDRMTELLQENAECLGIDSNLPISETKGGESVDNAPEATDNGFSETIIDENLDEAIN